MKKKTLRTILWRLTVISLIMLTLFGLLFYQLTDKLSRNRSLEYFEGLCVKAEQRVSTYLNEIQRTANLAAYSQSVQAFLFETTAYARVEAQPGRHLPAPSAAGESDRAPNGQPERGKREDTADGAGGPGV